MTVTFSSLNVADEDEDVTELIDGGLLLILLNFYKQITFVLALLIESSICLFDVWVMGLVPTTRLHIQFFPFFLCQKNHF